MTAAAHDGRPLRVLHCPYDVGGHASCLAAAERELGLDSRCITLAPSPFGYQGSESLTREGANPVWVELSRFRLFLRATRWADVVHFGFGSTIAPPNTWPTSVMSASLTKRMVSRIYRTSCRPFWGRDLASLAAHGKGIVVTFQGDDVRPSAGHPADVVVDRGQDERKRSLVRLFDRHAHAMYAVNPDLLRHLPARASFLPYANVDPQRVVFSSIGDHAGIIIAHAPTNRHVKGTADVVMAVHALQSEGHRVELDLIEGVTNAETVRRMAAADVVVDQLRVGWYGGLAVEAMSLGRPVIAFINSADLLRTPEAMQHDLPVIRTTQDTIEHTLRDFLALNAAERAAIGVNGRRYVEQWHDPLKIAAATADVYMRAVAGNR